MVAAAREKQDRERIEPLRLAERAALTLACKEVNLGQMRDKREQEESRREEQRLQHAMQLKTLQAQVGWEASSSPASSLVVVSDLSNYPRSSFYQQMAREEVEAREELARKKALCDALQQQVEYQRQRDDRLKEEQMAEGVRRLNQLREELHQERLAGTPLL